MEIIIYVEISFLSILSFFRLSFTIASYTCTLILPVSQLQTQQLMTSQIMSHMEYLTQTYNIRMITLHPKLMKNLASMAVFNSI